MEKSLQFSIDLGLSSLRGIMSLQEHGLRLEWRQFDIMDAPQGELGSILLPYSDFSGARSRRRTVELLAHQASTYGSIPLPAGDLSILKAKIKWADRKLTEAWTAEANLRIAEAQ